MKIWLALFLLLPVTVAHAFVEEYTETSGADSSSDARGAYNKLKKKNENQDKFYGGFRDLYRKFNAKVVVPGFISASPLLPIARIVGPDIMGTNFRVGDTLYLRWAGATPQPGAVYSTYTPAVVTQNMANATDFSVGLMPANLEKAMPKEHRLAGYFYEGSGRVRILRARDGLVEALLEVQTGQVNIGDQLMPALPIINSLVPTHSPVQLAAAIVCGSPPERISTNEKSFIYINRGSRDGVKVGQTFEAVERVKLDSSAGATSPENSAGEAVVVHTTDSYSTAMIIKQFDVIRIGSLLRTVNPLNPTLSVAPFTGMSKIVSKRNLPSSDKLDEIPEVPSLDDYKNDEHNLPDPMRKKEKAVAPLSELDAIEKGQNFQSLSEKEKTRLGKLSRQERLGEKGPSADSSEEDGGSGMPGLENSFAKGKKSSKKASKKKKKSNDEEELNSLMMQN